MRRVSKKQQVELARRASLRKELLAENPLRICTTCGRAPDWRGLQLSHKIALSRGGKTTRENCVLECARCHEYYEKRPELRVDKYKGVVYIEYMGNAQEQNKTLVDYSPEEISRIQQERCIHCKQWEQRHCRCALLPIQPDGSFCPQYMP